MEMNIDKIIEALNFLNMDYKITHTNDYSELEVPSNNELRDRIFIFDCESRAILDIDFDENYDCPQQAGSE